MIKLHAMKHITFTALFLISVFAANAQWIDNISIIPANPTVNDNVIFSADVSFPTGSCDISSQTASINGNSIYLSSLHCVGMLTFICSDNDTFHLGQLPAGTYTVYFQLDMGSLPDPCTPGINPGPNDSLTFTVSSTTGIPSLDVNTFSIFPNPGRDGFTLKYTGEASGIAVRDAGGRIAFETDQVKSGMFFSMSALKPGVYMIELLREEGNILRQSWVLTGEGK
jgi:hypothetical protein